MTTNTAWDRPGGAAQEKRYITNREWINNLKMVAGCVDCGYDTHPAALTFDHVRGKKVRRISRMMNGSRATLQAEVDKCEVRCANCHNIVTSERKKELVND